jgi:hypothetical protein
VLLCRRHCDPDRFSGSGRIGIGDVRTGDGVARGELWRWPLWRR